MHAELMFNSAILSTWWMFVSEGQLDLIYRLFIGLPIFKFNVTNEPTQDCYKTKILPYQYNIILLCFFYGSTAGLASTKSF